MIFNILKRECRFLAPLCLLIVNCAILLPNAILYIFNVETRLSSFEVRYSPYSEGGWPSSVFAPIGETDRALLDRTLRVFVAAVEKANLTYFIYGGTLIGSLRHHGSIPWDDDVDVMFSAVDKSKLIDALTALRPEYGLFMPIKDCCFTQWKLYPTDGHFFAKRKFRAPYVDIFFYQENRTHIWCESPKWNTTEVWLKRHIFPLHRRPFGNLSLPAPCNGMVVIGPMVNISMCRSRGYNHIKDKEELEQEISCQNLTLFYPFVRKSIVVEGPLSNSVKETLMFQNWTLQEITVNQFC